MGLRRYVEVDVDDVRGEKSLPKRREERRAETVASHVRRALLL